MKETLLIKHAVGGRTFVDSSKHGVHYHIGQAADLWAFTVTTPPELDLGNLLAWKEELNVFLFQEHEDKPTVKIWFYVQEQSVSFQADERKLAFKAKAMIEYIPHNYGYKL
ncbi:hypothetical protein SAMN04487969_11512 [Paenibacillus algorifonticola]|uniref:Uncharacterized protein n=1 Tax=Paenibacillus algorifonticola TaxID=684063 RepID=A0A1I2G935_9BACL|nr:hypothetical protein [Paenibacillus algorifonticola]SFF13679.1 hypothetical protein SAMN04487969_11512 [Paenibacillus algorifonticola]